MTIFCAHDVDEFERIAIRTGASTCALERERQAWPYERVSKTIDRYELKTTLGQGAMGVVYLARDTKLDREVAVKVLNEGVPAAIFHREAKAIARLSHPGIITLFDYSGPDAKTPYLVVERLHGKTLGELVKAPLEPLVCAAIGYEMALALQHAHNQGIVHRDLKPENIFIEPDGRVVLCDFGVARAYRSNAVHTLASQKTKLAGSPLYMSPEQILNPTSIGPASDLFSMGSLLYFMAAAVPPFDAPNVHKVLKAVTEGPMGNALDDKPRAYSSIVRRLLEKDPERRYATAGQVADSLLALFVNTAHRDPRRLVKQLYAQAPKVGMQTTQSIRPEDLKEPPINQTMVLLKPKEQVPVMEERRKKVSPRRQHQVLLGSVAFALSIVAIALLTRELDALEPLREWIRSLLRSY